MSQPPLRLERVLKNISVLVRMPSLRNTQFQDGSNGMVPTLQTGTLFSDSQTTRKRKTPTIKDREIAL